MTGKRKKRKLFLAVSLGIIILFSAINLVFNYMLDKYIEQKSYESVRYAMEGLNGRSLEKDKTKMVETGVIYVNENYAEVEDGFSYRVYVKNNAGTQESPAGQPNIVVFTFNEYAGVFDEADKKEIISYCSEHKGMSETQEIRQFEVDNTIYYVSQVKIIRYDNEKKQDELVTCIVAGNANALHELTDKISRIFFLISVASGIVICVAGIYMGIWSENDKQRLKHSFQNVSHELRTPIMNIQGYAEGIATGVMGDAPRAAEVILKESERMGILVDEILCLSRLDSGSGELKKDLVDMGELVYYCMGIIEAEASRRKIAIKAEIQRDIFCRGNEAWLEKAVSNIFSNALRYAKSEIRVLLKRDKKMLVLSIADDGEGIAPEDMPYVFDRYYKGKGGKLGIGLAVTRETVQLHRGKVEARNEDGAVFEIRLPCGKREG